MRKLVVVSVMCLCATVGAVPAGAATTTLFSSSVPGVVGSPPVVPAGICSVTITADGGRGGRYTSSGDVLGGAGASVTARIAVTPGDTLHVLVGGVGGAGGGEDGSLNGDGGIGGGGGGGYGAAGGGGASVVWTTDLVPLVVAGAGGGSNPGHSGGAGGLLGQAGGDGGANGVGGVGPRSGKGGTAAGVGGAGGGGGLDYAGGGGGGVGTGGAGGDNSPPTRDGGAGGTGNGTIGGGGGSGGGSSTDGVVGGSPPGSGSGGTELFGDGGAGVAPGGDGGEDLEVDKARGAGGGGGIGFGGGGGAGSGPGGGSAGGGAGYGAGGGAAGDGGGGGGGGSSFVTPSALSSSSALSDRPGDGQVTITYDPVADACPDETDPTVTLTAPGDSAVYARNQMVTADYSCDDAGGSGLASCLGTVPDGSAADTSTVGEHDFTVTGVDGSGNTTAVTHTYTVANGRPDGRIKKGTTGAFIGDDVYGTTGTGQTRTGSARPGRSVTYYVSAQNDAPFAEPLRLKGTASTGRFNVRYTAGTTDITDAVTAGSYSTPTLVPGATRVIKVVVTVKSSAPAEASLAATLVVKSNAHPTIRDTVGFVTNRR